MLLITRAPTCGLARGEISIHTQGEGKRINTPLSLALTYWHCVRAGTMEALYAWILQTGANLNIHTSACACAARIVNRYMCYTTCAYVYFNLIGQFNWKWKI